MTNDFARLYRNLTKAIEKGKEDGVKAIGAKAQDLCPKDSGKTASEIKVDPKEGTVVQAYYPGIAQELGTEDMPPHPYLRPAHDLGVKPMIRDIKANINKVLGD